MKENTPSRKRSRETLPEIEIDYSEYINLFPAIELRIGSWQYEGRNEGDLLVGFDCMLRRFYWEVLRNGVMERIEIDFSDVTGIQTLIMEGNQFSCLEVEVKKPPKFQIKRHIYDRQRYRQWTDGSDFTDGEAYTNLKHSLMFLPGVLDEPYKKLLENDEYLCELNRRSSSTSSFQGSSSTAAQPQVSTGIEPAEVGKNTCDLQFNGHPLYHPQLGLLNTLAPTMPEMELMHQTTNPQRNIMPSVYQIESRPPVLAANQMLTPNREIQRTRMINSNNWMHNRFFSNGANTQMELMNPTTNSQRNILRSMYQIEARPVLAANQMLILNNALQRRWMTNFNNQIQNRFSSNGANTRLELMNQTTNPQNNILRSMYQIEARPPVLPNIEVQRRQMINSNNQLQNRFSSNGANTVMSSSASSSSAFSSACFISSVHVIDSERVFVQYTNGQSRTFVRDEGGIFRPTSL